jgi:hypothetical protein
MLHQGTTTTQDAFELFLLDVKTSHSSNALEKSSVSQNSGTIPMRDALGR